MLSWPPRLLCLATGNLVQSLFMAQLSQLDIAALRPALKCTFSVINTYFKVCASFNTLLWLLFIYLKKHQRFLEIAFCLKQMQNKSSKGKEYIRILLPQCLPVLSPVNKHCMKKKLVWRNSLVKWLSIHYSGAPSIGVHVPSSGCRHCAPVFAYLSPCAVKRAMIFLLLSYTMTMV